MTTTTRPAKQPRLFMFNAAGFLYAGSISSDTHRPGDILHRFYRHFAGHAYRTPRGLAKVWRSLLSFRQWQRGTFDADFWNESEHGDEELAEMMERLESWMNTYNRLPPFHFLGTHPGDGADFGIWFSYEAWEFNRGDMQVFDEYPATAPANGWAIQHPNGRLTFYNGSQEIYEVDNF